MPSPFPGMDPFIEDQEWSDFHLNYISQIQALLAPRVEPEYYVRCERRVYVEHPDYENGDEIPKVRVPDVSVLIGDGGAAAEIPGGSVVAAPVECLVPMPEERRETFLLIRETKTREVITVIELLSPSNKRKGGDGWHEYLKKRDEVLRGRTHLVELDLLLGGTRLPLKPPTPAGDYYAIVSREELRPRVDVYAWRLPDRLPTIAIPLKESKESVPLDLAAALTAVYDRARYGLSIDYSVPLQTPIAPEQTKWLVARLQQG